MIYTKYKTIKRSTFLDKYGLLVANKRIEGEDNSHYRQRLINTTQYIINSTKTGLENAFKTTLYIRGENNKDRFFYLSFTPYDNIHVFYRVDTGNWAELNCVDNDSFLQGYGQCTVWCSEGVYTNILEIRANINYNEIMVEYDFINELNNIDHYTDIFQI